MSLRFKFIIKADGKIIEEFHEGLKKESVGHFIERHMFHRYRGQPYIREFLDEETILIIKED